MGGEHMKFIKKAFKFFWTMYCALGIIILVPIIILAVIAAALLTGYSVMELLWWGFIGSIVFALPLSWIRKCEYESAKKKLKKLKEETEPKEES